MKKIIVIGCPGSGKTTFAKKLRDKTGLPLYYLDSIWHKPDRTHISRDDFDTRLSEILREDSWIIDGNYQRTMPRRMEACDTVILFDLPTEVCIDGAQSRLLNNRDDIPWTDTKLDPDFKQQIIDFNIKNTPIIYKLLDKYRLNRSIIIFKTREESDSFLNAL